MGDNAPAASAPAKDLAQRHTAPPLHERSPNRLDNSGKRAAKKGKPPICKREVRRSRLRAAPKQIFHFPFDFREGRIQRPASWIDDNFALWTQLIEPQADGLADPSFNAVAHHGFSDRSRYGEADLGTQTVRSPDIKSGEQRSGIPGTLIIDSSEIGGSQNTDTFRKTCDVTTSRS